ncbi:hypothetical protein D3C72_1658330 [compost metagenome]
MRCRRWARRSSPASPRRNWMRSAARCWKRQVRALRRNSATSFRAPPASASTRKSPTAFPAAASSAPVTSSISTFPPRRMASSPIQARPFRFRPCRPRSTGSAATASGRCGSASSRCVRTSRSPRSAMPSAISPARTAIRWSPTSPATASAAPCTRSRRRSPPGRIRVSVGV